MSPENKERFKALARKMAQDSIVTTALARFVAQILEVASEEARRLERARCIEIAQSFKGKQAASIAEAIARTD